GADRGRFDDRTPYTPLTIRHSPTSTRNYHTVAAIGGVKMGPRPLGGHGQGTALSAPAQCALARRSETKYCPSPFLTHEERGRLSWVLAKVTANVRRYSYATRIQQTIVYTAL